MPSSFGHENRTIASSVSRTRRLIGNLGVADSQGEGFGCPSKHLSNSGKPACVVVHETVPIPVRAAGTVSSAGAQKSDVHGKHG